MEYVYNNDVAHSALRLRWRRSFRGGRTIAQPAATGRQLQAARRTANTKEGDPVEHTAFISTTSGMTANPEELMAAIAQLLANNSMVLSRAPEEATSLPGQWQSLQSATNGGPSGRMKLHLSSESEVEQVRKLLHDKTFQAGSDRLSLAVEDQGFRPRGARRRAGPPAAALHSA